MRLHTRSRAGRLYPVDKRAVFVACGDNDLIFGQNIDRACVFKQTSALRTSEMRDVAVLRAGLILCRHKRRAVNVVYDRNCDRGALSVVAVCQYRQCFCGFV